MSLKTMTAVIFATKVQRNVTARTCGGPKSLVRSAESSVVGAMDGEDWAGRAARSEWREARML